MSFAIYHHQTKIFVVLAGGMSNMKRESLSFQQVLHLRMPISEFIEIVIHD